MGPADCVQKSALIIQLGFLLFMSGRVRGEPGGRASELWGLDVDSTAAALKKHGAHTERGGVSFGKKLTMKSRKYI